MNVVRTWLAAVAVLAVAALAAAQTTNGTISGHVADFQGLALPGVTVNAISPGPILTPASEALVEANPEFRKMFDGMSMLERFGFPLDVAYMGLFLASDESTFITGANFTVDGGATAKVGASFLR